MQQFRTTSWFMVMGVMAGVVGCGYTPVYSPSSTTANLPLRVGSVTMEQVEKAPGERRVAQVVAQELALSYPDNRAGNSPATIVVVVKEDTTTLALDRTAVVRRAEVQLTGTANVISAEGKTLLTARVATSAPYNVENNPFSTESGKTFARLTAARNLAAELNRRLALFQRTYAQMK